MRVPFGQGWPPAGSESYAVRATEAVKRRQRGRRLRGGLRNHPLRTPTLYVEWEGNITDAELAWHRWIRRSEEAAGHATEGSPGTLRLRSGQALGDPIVSILNQPVGEPGDQNPGPSRVVLAGVGSEAMSTGWYRWARKRAYRDGQWGVGATHSIDEAGEPSSKGPGGGKGSPGKRN